MHKSPQFCVSVPDPHFRKLTKLAKEDGRSRSNYVARILAEHLSQKEAKAA